MGVVYEKNISHTPSDNKYSIDKSILTQQDIANIPIIKYEITNIKKKGKKYIVSYDKYIIKNPYEILNYFSDLNVKVEDESEIYNTTELYKYLTRQGKISNVKEMLTKEVLDTLAKKEKSIDITYTLNDGSLKMNK